MRALTGTLTPDCSFSDCSECGVCGTERGNNVVSTPPPIPAYTGDWRPDTTKATSLRLTLAKRGDASLLSHLDTFRLFDRAFRRARLPISFSGGFHPKPRVAAASALPFGATADAELFDLTFITPITAQAFSDAFAPELPPGFDVVHVVEIPATAALVSNRMRAAEYLLGVYLPDEVGEAAAAAADEHADADGEAEGAAGMAATQSPVAAATTTVLVDSRANADAVAAAPAADAPAPLRPDEVDWAALVAATMAMTTCPVTRSTNGGKGDATRTVDLRSRLYALRLATPAEAAPVLAHVGPAAWPPGATVLAATTLASNDGALSPDDTVELLRVAAAGVAPGLELLHAHRRGLLLASEEQVAAVAVAAKAAARTVRKEREAAAAAVKAAHAERRARGAAAAAAARAAAREAAAATAVAAEGGGGAAGGAQGGIAAKAE